MFYILLPLSTLTYFSSFKSIYLFFVNETRPIIGDLIVIILPFLVYNLIDILILYKYK